MCDYCDYDLYIREIDGMLEESQYNSSRDVLWSIRDWTDSHKHITAKQIKVVGYIIDSKKD